MFKDNRKNIFITIILFTIISFLSTIVFLLDKQLERYSDTKKSQFSISCKPQHTINNPYRDKCSSIIVAKDLTADASMLLAHNEDLNNYCAHHYFYTPRIQYQSGEKIKTYFGEIPQVSDTYAYTGTTIFDINYSPGAITSGINEHLVAVVNNMSYRRDPIENPDNTNRLIWTEFIRFALERAKTASEAVDVIGSLAKQYKLGTDTGSIFGIVDKDEGWWVEVTQEGQWVAERIKPGTATCRANIFRICEVNFSSFDFKYSEDLVSYAVEQGWYDPKDTFNFTKVYADPSKVEDNYNVLREDRINNMLENFVASKNITQKLIFTIWRDHYENYMDGKYDETKNHTQGSPHNTNWRTLCRLDTEISVVIQSRKQINGTDVPAEIGAICWRAMATPCMSIYIPWYLAQQDIPIEYRTGNSQFTKKSAYWTARNLSRIADMHYNKTVFDKVRKVQEDFEWKEFADQSEIEKKAITLYSQNPESARIYLSKYTSTLAKKASARLNTLTKFAEKK